MSFVTYLINGISLGSVYALIALGYTMVYGIAKMLNFAHGDVIMIGAFTTYTICSTMGLSPLIGVPAAVIVCTVLGMVIEKIAYKPLRKAASPLAVLITAIGVSYLLQNLALLIFGRRYKILYLRSAYGVHQACRRSDQYYGRDHCHYFILYCHYGRSDAFYQ